MAEIPVEINNDLEEEIAKNFTYFDFRSDKCASVLDVEKILHFMGCVPTKAEIDEIIKISLYEPGYVHLSYFMPYVCEMLFTGRMCPAKPDALLEAFQAIDKDNVGYLTVEQFRKALTQDGLQPLNEEQFNVALKAAYDATTGTIPYDLYLRKIMHIPQNADDIYKVAEIARIQTMQARASAKIRSASQRRSTLAKQIRIKRNSSIAR